MSTYPGTLSSTLSSPLSSPLSSTVSLSPQETLARDLIVERVAARHHAPRAARVRRTARAAMLLRSLAERLDPSSAREATASAAPQPPHAGSPRPWSAQQRPVARRTPHRHS
ncbi:hypothetical protein [Terrabacter sp. 2RAF25]|uniref:hypothetical protein n=1 Tax=Terrabacter sp. 2RAF25 TaxID=3232998 RepID=UPI003F9C1F8E